MSVYTPHEMATKLGTEPKVPFQRCLDEAVAGVLVRMRCRDYYFADGERIEAFIPIVLRDCHKHTHREYYEAILRAVVRVVTQSAPGWHVELVDGTEFVLHVAGWLGKTHSEGTVAGCDYPAIAPSQ